MKKMDLMNNPKKKKVKLLINTDNEDQNEQIMSNISNGEENKEKDINCLGANYKEFNNNKEQAIKSFNNDSEENIENKKQRIKKSR